MSGRKTRLPEGTQIKDGKVILPAAKPRDASQAKAWANGKKKKIRVAKRGVTSLLNSIGKLR